MVEGGAGIETVRDGDDDSAVSGTSPATYDGPGVLVPPGAASPPPSPRPAPRRSLDRHGWFVLEGRFVLEACPRPVPGGSV